MYVQFKTKPLNLIAKLLVEIQWPVEFKNKSSLWCLLALYIFQNKAYK